MQIFKTGKQVTRAVKNVQRLRTILGVFWKHGLEEIFIRMGLQKYGSGIAKDVGVEQLSIPERLRMAFETLGPTFVKLGQMLGNRPDFIPEEYIEEFKKLQDNVQPVSFEIMKPFIEREIGGSLEVKFKNFNPVPIASASIAQVYEAQLHTGEDVVLKVQRPDIEKSIKNDLSILLFLAEAIEKYIPELQLVAPTKFADEFATSLMFELDFVVEANSTIKVAENFRNSKNIIIPKVYRELSTSRILVLEHIFGIKINDIEKLKASGLNPARLVDIGARAFFQMLIVDGLYHGDLHGGNLFALKDPNTGEEKIGVIDFGIIGRLSLNARDAFARIVLALMTEDFETLCYEYADLANIGAGVDFESFQREVRNSVAPYMGLSIKDVNTGQILINSTKIAFRYNIRLPRDWMMVFKAIFALEGLGKQLDPNFDFLAIGNDLVKSTMKERFSWSRITKDMGWLAKDVNALVQVAPRQIRWMFKKFNSNDFAFEIKLKEIEVLRKQLEKSSRGLGLSIVCASLFISAAISMNSQNSETGWQGYSVPALIFLVSGFLGFMSLIFKKWK